MIGFSYYQIVCVFINEWLQTYIQKFLKKMWVVNNGELDKAEIIQQIFKGKTTIVKIAMGSDIFKLKYIQIHGELEITLYQQALSTMDSFYQNVSRLISTHQSGSIKRGNQLYLFIKSPFLMAQNLERALMIHPARSEGYYCNFIQLLPFMLLDCFIQNIELNTLIINESNIYLFPNHLAINQISFVGADLIFFEKDIRCQDFKAIFNYLHSNTFQKQPSQRLNHQQKIKNFAAILLVFLINRPVRLLEHQKLPELINMRYANDLLKKSSQFYQKFLNINHIRIKIEQHSKHWPLNLHEFFYQMLVQQKDYSWSEIYGKFCFESHLDLNLRALIQHSLSSIWSKLSSQQKKYFCQKRYIKAQQTDERISIYNSYILLTLALRLKLASLKNGSIFDELADKRKFDMLTMEIVTGIVNLSVQAQKESFKQSVEVHDGRFHDRVFLLRDKYMEREQSQDSNETLRLESFNQPLQWQEKYQNLKQGSQKHVKVQEIQLEPLTKEAALDLSKQLYKDKMVNSIEVQGKSIKIDHSRVKALNEFENSFR